MPGSVFISLYQSKILVIYLCVLVKTMCRWHAVVICRGVVRLLDPPPPRVRACYIKSDTDRLAIYYTRKKEYYNIVLFFSSFTGDHRLNEFISEKNILSSLPTDTDEVKKAFRDGFKKTMSAFLLSICRVPVIVSRPRCAPSLYRVQRRILYLGVGAQKIYWSCCWVQNKLYFWTNVYRFYILFFVFHPILQRCNLCLSIQLLLLMIAEFKGPFKY